MIYKKGLIYLYNHVCNKCKKEFSSKKKTQQYCSKSCANSVNSSKRKIEDETIYESGLNKINSYILGIIYSDGCISYDKHTKRYRITIAMNDLDVMEKIHKLMTPNKKLYSYKHSRGTSTIYSIISTNKSDIEFLFKLGVTENKSLIIDYPNIPKNFDSHFIRGYFDGDGSIYKSTTNTYYNQIKKSYDYYYVRFTTGSKGFALSLSNKLNMYGIQSNIYKDTRMNSKSFYIAIYKKESIKKFFEFIYEDCEIFMMRKYNKFINMI